MKKKIILLIYIFVCASAGFAQEAETLPEGMHFEVRNDTLFVVTDDEGTMPHHVVFQQADRPNIYRRIYNDETDDLMEDHPADDIYKSIWTSAHVNPYQLPIDSIQDSTVIDLSGFSLPVPGHITSKFGPRRYRYHYGVDLKLQTGDSVRSAFDGQVRIVGWDARGYGNYVVVRHTNGLETVYGHLSMPLVYEDMRVYSGEAIGLGGNTGRSTGPHLHFEFRYLGNAFNPELIIDFATGTTRDSTYLITKNGSFYHKMQAQRNVAQGSTGGGGAKYYTIRKGDTLGAIARRNNTTVRKLCQLNGLRENSVLQIGKRIRIR